MQLEDYPSRFSPLGNEIVCGRRRQRPAAEQGLEIERKRGKLHLRGQSMSEYLGEPPRLATLSVLHAIVGRAGAAPQRKHAGWNRHKDQSPEPSKHRRSTQAGHSNGDHDRQPICCAVLSVCALAELAANIQPSRASSCEVFSRQIPSCVLHLGAFRTVRLIRFKLLRTYCWVFLTWKTGGRPAPHSNG
jgi:hypothetical protein